MAPFPAETLGGPTALITRPSTSTKSLAVSQLSDASTPSPQGSHEDMDTDSCTSSQRKVNFHLTSLEAASQAYAAGRQGARSSLTKKRKVPRCDNDLVISPSAFSFSAFPASRENSTSSKLLSRSNSEPSFDLILQLPPFTLEDEEGMAPQKNNLQPGSQAPAAAAAAAAATAPAAQEQATRSSTHGTAPSTAGPADPADNSGLLAAVAAVTAPQAAPPAVVLPPDAHAGMPPPSVAAVLPLLNLSFQPARAADPALSGVSALFLLQLCDLLPPCLTTMEVLKQVVLPSAGLHSCRFVDMISDESAVGRPSIVLCHFLDSPFQRTAQHLLDSLPPGTDPRQVFVWMDVFSCVHSPASLAQLTAEAKPLAESQSAPALAAPAASEAASAGGSSGSGGSSESGSRLQRCSSASQLARHVWSSPTALLSAPQAFQDAQQALQAGARVLVCLDFHAMTLSQPLSLAVLYHVYTALGRSSTAPFVSSSVLGSRVQVVGEDVDLTSLQEALQHLSTWEACACGVSNVQPAAQGAGTEDSRAAAAGNGSHSQRVQQEQQQEDAEEGLRRMLLASAGALPQQEEGVGLGKEGVCPSSRLLWLLGSKMYGQATGLGHQLLKEYAGLHGLSHPCTIKVICGLAVALYEQGEHGAQQADRLLALVLESKSSLGRCEGGIINSVAAWISSLARQVQMRGAMHKAEALLRLAVDLRLSCPDPDTPATIAALSSLAAVLELRGSFHEAEKLLQRRLAICDRLFPTAQHPERASSLIHLGIIQTSKGEHARALQLGWQGLEMRREIFGRQHLASAAAAADLASLYRQAALADGAAGHLQQAQQLLSTCLEIRRDLLGPGHPDVLTTLDALGSLLQAQGSIAGLAPLYSEAREACRGLDCEGGVLSSWAGKLKQLGRFKESEEMFREALMLQVNSLGAHHLDTATTMGNLAVVLHRQGSYEEAEDLCRSCLAIKQKLLGSCHPDVATVRNNLAGLLKSQGRYEEAEQLYWKSLETLQKAFGRRHLETTAMMNNLAALLAARGKLYAAEVLYKEYLSTIQGTLGEEHPDLAVGMNNLAALLCRQGKYDEAEPLASRALHIWQTHLGPEHPDTAASLHNLAALYKAQQKYEAAEKLYSQSVEVTEKMLGPEHPNLAASFNNLAVLAQAQGDYSRAEPLYRRCLHIYDRALGPEHPNAACSLGNLLKLLRMLGRDEDADELLVVRQTGAPSPSRPAPLGAGLWRSGSLPEAQA